MVGRGVRLCPDTDKEDCLVMDLVDNETNIGSLSINPELWSECKRKVPRQDSDEREEERTSNPLYTKHTRYSADQFKLTYVNIHDPLGMEESLSETVKRTSANAWVCCGKGKWVLDVLGQGMIEVSQCITKRNEKIWRMRYRQSNYHNADSDGAPVQTNTNTTIWAYDVEEAIRKADVYARKRFDEKLNYQLSRNASWRDKRASEPAIRLLLKRLGHDLVPSDQTTYHGMEVEISGRTIKVGGLSSGQVASLLCASIHGDKEMQESLRAGSSGLKIRNPPTTDASGNSDTLQCQESRDVSEEEEGKELLDRQGLTNTIMFVEDSKDIWRRDNTRVLE